MRWSVLRCWVPTLSYLRHKFRKKQPSLVAGLFSVCLCFWDLLHRFEAVVRGRLCGGNWWGHPNVSHGNVLIAVVAAAAALDIVADVVEVAVTEVRRCRRRCSHLRRSCSDTGIKEHLWIYSGCVPHQFVGVIDLFLPVYLGRRGRQGGRRGRRRGRRGVSEGEMEGMGMEGMVMYFGRLRLPRRGRVLVVWRWCPADAAYVAVALALNQFQGGRRGQDLVRREGRRGGRDLPGGTGVCRGPSTFRDPSLILGILAPGKTPADDRFVPSGTAVVTKTPDPLDARVGRRRRRSPRGMLLLFAHQRRVG